METLYLFLILFGGGVIRGYSGFGFAMICVILFSFVYPPSVITPLILCLEIPVSTWLFYKVRRQVGWKSLKILFISSMVTIPIGSFALTSVPVSLLRTFLSVTVLLLCLGLLIKKQTARATGPATTVAVGMFSGFLTGIAAIGGPPVILFYISSNRSVAISRASMIAFFLVVDCMALVSCLWYGLLDYQILVLSAKMLIPLSAGIWIGNYLFGKFLNEEKFKRQAIILLMILAFISLIKSMT
jgi:uncharacterized membrane protein YfcA